MTKAKLKKRKSAEDSSGGGRMKYVGQAVPESLRLSGGKENFKTSEARKGSR